MATGFLKIIVLLCVFLLYWTLPLVQAEKHSLYYIYTALSKPVDLPGIYEFSAMGLLDDTQIDYYNSKEKRKIPKQQWMKEKMQEDYWEKGTQSRKSKEQWFNVSVSILMNRMRHDESDLHVLQWRVGCEVERWGDEVKFLKGIDEYGYDGENFLSFDDKKSQWVAPVDEALPTKRKWDNNHTLSQYTKGYLEKECVDWLNKYREYRDEELRNTSPPDVYIFAKKSIKDKTILKLTCLATGFNPKDVMVFIRKYRTSLPEENTESSGIRPNNAGSFQIMKSVEIKEDERAEYDCFVTHSTFKEPIIKKWVTYSDNSDKLSHIHRVLTGVVIGGGIVLAVVALMVCILVKKNYIVFHCTSPPEPDEDKMAGLPLLEVHSTNPPEPDEDEIAGILEGRDTAGRKTDLNEAWTWGEEQEFVHSTNPPEPDEDEIAGILEGRDTAGRKTDLNEAWTWGEEQEFGQDTANEETDFSESWSW